MLVISTTTSTTALVLAVVGASAVEMVEALTLVLAAGTRNWRSAREGAAAAVVVLGGAIAIVGVPLSRDVPIGALHAAVGVLLLLLGASWLRKAVLRASGRMAKHDEDAIYARTAKELRDGARPTRRRDRAAFSVAFKGVLLEGFEVVIIVIGLGTSSHRLALAAASAAATTVIVGIVGAIVARQLSAVPENTIKTVVGVLLTSFGVFWIGEGAGVKWPGHELALVALVAATALLSGAVVMLLRRGQPGLSAPSTHMAKNCDPPPYA